MALAETVSGGGTHASTSTRAGDQPPQPIAKRRKTQPAKDVSLPPPSRPVPSSPTHPTLAVSSRTAGGNGNGATASSTMSAAAAADHGQPFPNLAASSKQLAAPIKFQPRYGGYAEEPEPRARLRRQARENSERNEPYVESFTRGTRRGTVGPDATSVEMGDAPTTELAGAASSSPRVQPSRAARLSSAASTFPNLRTTRQGKKSGPQDDAVDDTPVSPTTTAPRLSAPPPPGAGEVARPDTPTQRPGAARKLRTGPRIKTS